MEMEICSIKRNEFITPDSTIHYDLRRNTYMYLEVDGTARVELGKQVEIIRPGEAIIGAKFQIHNAQDQCLTLRGFMFNWTASNVVSHQSGIYRDSSLNKRISHIFDHTNCPIQLSHQLSECVQQIQTLMSSPSLEQEASYEQNKGIMDKRLIMVHRYIRGQFQQPVTLQQLSDLIACNPVYLSNTYSRVFRMSPMKHIQNLRMEKAKELLIERKLGIGQIANTLGYISASQFSDLFKKYYQMTPSQYRVNHALEKFAQTNQGGTATDG